MNDLPQKISREEFYERIWNTPIVQLGKELGFTYVEMVQLCKKLNVPRPEPGYWYRRQHGGVEEKTALPPADPETPRDVQLRHQSAVQPEQQKAKDQSLPIETLSKNARKPKSDGQSRNGRNSIMRN